MTSKKVLTETFKNWLPLAVVIVIFSGLAYAVVQQNYRQNANDPQVQITEDIAAAIEQGTSPDQIAPPTGTTDIRQSLSPWVMIYDNNGKLIGSTAILDGKNPSYPTGVFDEVKKSGKDARVTWQPENGVRMATVVTRYSGAASGYVIAGRSLREVEIREKLTEIMCAVAMLFALIITFLLAWLFEKMKHRQMVITETTVEVSQDKMIS
jgi:hypothetical protein